MSIVFIIIAIVCFLIDLILTVAAPSAGPVVISAFFYGGLASFAASFLPLGGPWPWARS